MLERPDRCSAHLELCARRDTSIQERVGPILGAGCRPAKNFNFAGPRGIEVLFDVFNVTDRVNFSGDLAYSFNNAHGRGPEPNNNLGTPTSIVLNSNRQAEFGLRFRF